MEQPRSIFFLRGSLGALLYLPAFLIALFSPGLWPPASGPGLAAAIVGGAIVLAGTLWRSYAQLFVGGRKSAELVRQGPYACCRHPLYFGSFLVGAGSAVMLASLTALVFFAAVFQVLYHFVIREEERILSHNHGDAYAEFRRAVPRKIFPARLPRIEERYITIDLKAQHNQFKRSLVTLAVVPLLAIALWLRARGELPAFLPLP